MSWRLDSRARVRKRSGPPVADSGRCWPGVPVAAVGAGLPRLKGAQMRSCSSAVLVQQTAEQVAPTHSGLLILGDNGQPGGLIWRLEPERPMREVFVVVPDVDPQDPLEVAVAR
jgi:hypothetical protein